MNRRTNLHPRLAIAPLFLLGIAMLAERDVPQLEGIRTDEGQSVAFNRGTYMQRELAKVLPLDAPWPAGAELAKALARYGLNQSKLPQVPPMPSRIAAGVYLVGQDRRSTNLTYMIDCGPDGVAVIAPSYDSEFEHTVDNIERCGRARK